MGNKKNSRGNGEITPLTDKDHRPGDPCILSRHKGLGTVDAHIIPRYRNGGNGDNLHRGRCRGCEDDYHRIFTTMTPAEAIEHLVEYFWNGDQSHVLEYLSKNRG